MRIQHNIMAMNAYRNYSNNTSALGKNLEKLSSGYKINRAGDDAAGLAISEKMRAQITGLATAQKNAKDGISLIQTAEGALTEVHDMLNRMVELADQSANGTYDDEVDRANLQKEFDALRSEVDRISKASNFNGINLLNGEQKAGADISKMTGIDIAALSSTGVPGSGTILHTKETPAAKSKFTVELGNLSFGNATGQKLTIDLGGGGDGTGAGLTLELEGDGSGKLDAQGIQAALTAKYGKDGASEGSVKINGEDFVLTGSGSTITLEQKEAPSDASKVVEPSMSVAISATDAPDAGGGGGAAAGTKGVYDVAVGTAFVNGETLTINGKEIKFDDSGNAGTINAANVTTAADQMKAIKALFADDANFDVALDDDTNPTKLVFTQKTASAANAMTGASVSASAGDATGAVGAIAPKDGVAAVSATPGSYTVKIDAALANGESLTIGGQTIRFGSGNTFDINTDNINTAADQATAIKDFFAEPNISSAWEVTLDDTDPSGQTLKFTEKVPTGAAASNVAVTDNATGSAYITADADGMAAGTYTLNVDAAFAASESLVIGNKTIDFYDSGTAGYIGANIGVDINGISTKEDMAAAIAAAMSGGNAASAPTGYSVTYTAGQDTITFTQAAVDENKPLTATVNSGAVAVGTGKIDLGAGGGAQASGTPTAAGYAPGTAGVWEMDITSAFANGEQVTIGGQTITFGTDTGSGEINASDASSDAADEQAAAIAAKLTASGAFAGYTVANTGSKLTFTQKIADADAPAPTYTATATKVTTGGATFNETTAAVDPEGGGAGNDVISGDWNAATTVIAQGTEQKDGRLASTTVNLTAAMVKDGQSMVIGDKTYTFKIGKDSTTAAKAGETLVDLSAYEADAADLLERAAEALSNATADNGVFTSSGYDGTKVTFLEKEGQTKADLSTLDNMKAQFSYGTKATASGLKLQIGENSEDYNQLTVSINKMDCASLGIDASKINISSQEGASRAVAAIKDAIDSVSGTRGDLGALQNRLEHTINNLSVMQENIQDAEATIRDVDVAQEMMEYTKNNILVQSAQAMLAQANQVPQGVLQLLQ